MKGTLYFYTNEYVEHHLRPDEWPLDTETDAEASRKALQLIAERLGKPAGLVRFSSYTSDTPDVETCQRIGGAWTRIGYAEFVY